MRNRNYYIIGFIALFSLNACAPQDSASAEGSTTADEVARNNNQAAEQLAPVEPAPAPEPAPVVCQSCGTVRSVTAITEQGRGTGAGAVIGAIVGGVAGNQVGGGTGRDLATAAGVVGGALLGNTIERNRNSAAYYEVVIDMESGGQQVINLENPAGLATGTSVSVVNGNITIR